MEDAVQISDYEYVNFLHLSGCLHAVCCVILWSFAESTCHHVPGKVKTDSLECVAFDTCTWCIQEVYVCKQVLIFMLIWHQPSSWLCKLVHTAGMSMASFWNAQYRMAVVDIGCGIWQSKDPLITFCKCTKCMRTARLLYHRTSSG